MEKACSYKVKMRHRTHKRKLIQIYAYYLLIVEKLWNDGEKKSYTQHTHTHTQKTHFSESN